MSVKVEKERVHSRIIPEQFKFTYWQNGSRLGVITDSQDPLVFIADVYGVNVPLNDGTESVYTQRIQQDNRNGARYIAGRISLSERSQAIQAIPAKGLNQDVNNYKLLSDYPLMCADAAGTSYLHIVMDSGGSSEGSVSAYSLFPPSTCGETCSIPTEIFSSVEAQKSKPVQIPLKSNHYPKMHAMLEELMSRISTSSESPLGQVKISNARLG
ncbi:hypothetical protein GG344DRAFT_66107 [Lentinula edodes]|nr:hypothetical protein GG344DRAFT_66107 [Lentinula edodes]